MFPQFFSVYLFFRLKCCYNTYRTRENSTAHGREVSRRRSLSERMLLVIYKIIRNIVIYSLRHLFTI